MRTSSSIRTAVLFATATAIGWLLAGCSVVLGADFDRPARTEQTDDRLPAGSSSTGICQAGYADCNDDWTDGCETEIASDHQSCGGCGRACAPHLVCGRGECLESCPEGTRACGGSCKASGVNACGDSCEVCPTPAYGAPLCLPAGCSFECRTSYVRAGSACVDGASTNSWIPQVASMATPRSGHAAAISKGRIYVIGGRAADDRISSSVDAYSPATNTWAAVPNMPTARTRAGAAVSQDGRIFVIGGSSDRQTLATVEAYDPATNAWSRMADMPTSRSSLVTVTAPDGRIFAIGGSTSEIDVIPSKIVEVYTPSTNKWTRAADMPTARRGAGGVLAPDGRIFVVGGRINGLVPLVAAVEAYTPATDSWEALPNIPAARADLAVSASDDGRIFAIGGASSGTNATSRVDVYTPTTKSWAQAANMPSARVGLASVATDGRIYVIGGNVNDASATVEAYRP